VDTRAGATEHVKENGRHYQEGGGLLMGKLEFFYCSNLGTPDSEEVEKTQDIQVIYNSGFSDGRNESFRINNTLCSKTK